MPSIEVVPPVKVVLTPVGVQTFDVIVSAPNPVVQVVSEGPQGPVGPQGPQGETGLFVFAYGTAVPNTRPDGLSVYWQGTSAPGTAISEPGDLWYDTTGDS